ncbi:hypothetical protein BDZ89DRAFT_980223 [Hymenopellis radicata]|nr:hypothetical protein BDZ89DRAFT_980223 [Hymenopellis radicata]
MHCAAWRSRQTLCCPATSPGFSPFAQALQLAAGRAWARHSSSNARPPTKPPVKAGLSKRATRQSFTRHDTVATLSPPPSSRTQSAHVQKPLVFNGYPSPARFVLPNRPDDRGVRVSGVEPFLSPERLSDHDFVFDDRDSPWGDDRVDVDAPVASMAVSVDPLEASHLPQATTRKILYDNLQLIWSQRSRPALTQMIYYHLMHHSCRSTRSYNFLLSLALRYNAFALAELLFRDMKKDRLEENSDTKTLRIRWLVATGYQDQAWREMLGAAQDDVVRIDHWIELFCPPKRMDNPLPITPITPTQFLALFRARSRLIRSSAPVRLIIAVLKAALHIGRRAFAFNTAMAYLSALPEHLDAPDAMRYMDVVHLFVMHGSLRSGVSKFYEYRQILLSFLALHPALEPNPRTLCFLFSHLRRCRNSGTIALQTLNMFKLRWGPQVESRDVRRLVVDLTVKEMKHLKIAERLAHDAYLPRSLKHPTQKPPASRSDRSLYPRRGTKNVKWVQSQTRLARALHRREQTRLSLRVKRTRPSQTV